MRTYGEAQFRNPFGTHSEAPAALAAQSFPNGQELAKRIASRVSINQETADGMKRDAATLRKSKGNG